MKKHHGNWILKSDEADQGVCQKEMNNLGKKVEYIPKEENLTAKLFLGTP